jgi:hypothetical protein
MGALLLKRFQHYTQSLHNQDVQIPPRVRNKTTTERRITYEIEQMQNTYGSAGPVRKLCCHPCWGIVSLTIVSNHVQTFITGRGSPHTKEMTRNKAYLTPECDF